MTTAYSIVHGGYILANTYLGLSLYIVATTFKVLNVAVLLLMYLSREVLSVENTEPVNSIYSSFLNSVSILLAMVAAVNSNLGMVTGFFGATLAFPMTNPQCV